MFLVDTNVWLELLLEQKNADKVRGFLSSVDSNQLFMTDFAFHSIGIVLAKLKRIDAMLQFVQDTLLDGSVNLVHLRPEDVASIVGVMKNFGLDFDDAYQYLAAEKFELTIISFDSDFKHTKRGYKTPDKVV
jgi:predicted nucleic acid-binding protein